MMARQQDNEESRTTWERGGGGEEGGEKTWICDNKKHCEKAGISERKNKLKSTHHTKQMK